MTQNSTSLPANQLLTWIDLEPGRQPKYEKLYQAIRKAVLNGQLPSNSRLPSTRQLAKSLELSRNTVIAAFEMLVAEGYLQAQQGAGHTVCENLPDPFFLVEPNADTASAPMDVNLGQRGQWADQIQGKEDIGAPKAFSPGIPDYYQIPMDLLARFVGRHWRHAKADALGYAPPNGYAPLREAITQYLNTCRGVRCQPDQVFITSGAQQALDLIGQIFLNPGSPVWMENPGYQGARGMFQAHGAALEPRSIDSQGMVIAAPFQTKPKLIYVTPSHQYPLGVTMSLKRRLELLNFANSQGSWVIEDDYDSEFRYEGRPLPALQGLANATRVLYVGTFSKVLFPSLRVGYLVIPKNLVHVFSRARAFRDSSPPTLIQAALAEFIEKGHFISHLRRMRQAYRERQTYLRDLLQNQTKSWLTVDPTPAGMHLVARLRQTTNDKHLAEQAARVGLSLRALSDFYWHPPEQAGFVLGFAGFPKEKLQAAMEKLTNFLQKTCPLC